MKLKDHIFQLRQGHIWRLKVSRRLGVVQLFLKTILSVQSDRRLTNVTRFRRGTGETTHDLKHGALFIRLFQSAISIWTQFFKTVHACLCDLRINPLVNHALLLVK